MAEPYSEEHEAIAIEVLSRAHKELVSRGLTEIEACHALIHAGVDWLAQYTCADCLIEELDAAGEAVSDRLDEAFAAADRADKAAVQGAVH